VLRTVSLAYIVLYIYMCIGMLLLAVFVVVINLSVTASLYVLNRLFFMFKNYVV